MVARPQGPFPCVPLTRPAAWSSLRPGNRRGCLRHIRAKVAAPALAGLMAMLAGGCTLGPDYARPTIEAPATYRFAETAPEQATLAAVSEWWRGFGDPDLDALVLEALVANHDLRIATARVDEFAAR